MLESIECISDSYSLKICEEGCNLIDRLISFLEALMDLMILIMFGPGAVFVSFSHSNNDIKKTLKICRSSMKNIKKMIKNRKIEYFLKGQEMKKVITF